MGSPYVILIFSQAQLEPTTEEVMDWIERLGGRSVRLNGEDLDGDAALVLTLDGRAGGGRSRLRIVPASPASAGAPTATAGAAGAATPLSGPHPFDFAAFAQFNVLF